MNQTREGTNVNGSLSRIGDAQEPILVFEKVRKSYGELLALDDVSFKLHRGEVACLIGPSGSGKSTLLRCANALERVDGGRIIFEGIDLASSSTNVRKLRQRMGMVFQNFELFPHFTVLRNITIGPTVVLGTSMKDAAIRGMELLRKVGLPEKANEHPAALSGGQQQRVAIARALANGPPLILADEPCASLDARTASEVLAIFLTVCRQDEKTLLLVSHEEAALGGADRVIDMAELNRAEARRGSA
jgi:polar amino acid transport system ATP-binding protein